VAATDFPTTFTAFTSDCAPHWGPPEFTEWEQYGRMWASLVEWLADA